MALSPTQAAILAAALQHPEQLVAPPRLAPAPLEAIRDSLLATGLIEPAAPDDSTAWTVYGAAVHYRLTGEGRRAAAGRAEEDSPAQAARDGPVTATGASEGTGRRAARRPASVAF
jgi:hypothetical protein